MDNATPACPACGAPVVRRTNRGPRPKYCSDDECKAERSRRRANAWYARRIVEPEIKARRREQGARADKRWREANPDYVKQRLAEYRAGNPEAIAEQYRRWRTENAEKVREKNQRRRARLLGAFIAPVDPDHIWERDGGICQLCGDPIAPSLAGRIRSVGPLIT